MKRKLLRETASSRRRAHSKAEALEFMAETISQLKTDPTTLIVDRVSSHACNPSRLSFSALRAFATHFKMTSLAYSFVDQALAVGGSFLGNVVLARSQTKAEYGMFAL